MIKTMNVGVRIEKEISSFLFASLVETSGHCWPLFCCLILLKRFFHYSVFNLIRFSVVCLQFVIYL